MEFQKARIVIVLGLLAVPVMAQQALRYEVRHEHLRKSCSGTLTIDERGVSFRGSKTQHAWNWNYPDIQQLTVTPGAIRVLTYKDNAWKLGADREYRFKAAAGGSFAEAYEFLKGRLDQRLVSELADADVKPLWQVPVKLLGRIQGSEGMLIVSDDRIAFRSDRKGQSRIWRYIDIDNISASGPFQLTVTTFERSRAEYGSRKGFNFQLKERLEEERYNELWRRLNRRKTD